MTNKTEGIKKNIPHHLGVIIDGNRRWAKEKGLPSFRGHWQGYKKLIEFCEWCKNKGVKILTVFCFSTENWNRTEKEINYLMRLAEKCLLNKKNTAKFQRDKIKLKIIGQKERLPAPLQKAIADIENLTKDNKELQVNFALSYGGRWDILQAVQKIISKKIPLETEDLISKNLSTPDVDLIIRTSKEQRISNFLIWQASYSEFYFCKKYWPDFTEKDLDDAIKEYGQRQRKLGR